MRKEALRNIIKNLKKDGHITISFEPTLEECDYLASKNIAITKSLSTFNGIVGNTNYSVTTFDFVLDK